MGKSDISNYTLDDCELDEYGVQDPFRRLITGMVKKVVTENKWFTFCKKVDDRQVDIMSIENNKGIKLGRLIGSKYYSESSYRTGIYKHFLRDYLCLYEVPAVKKSFDTDSFKNGFDKSLVTSNIAVIAAWLGIPMEEAAEKYASYLDDAYLDLEDDEVPYVKLYQKKSGEKAITKPRTRLDLSKIGTRVMPLFALKEGIDYLYEQSKDKVLRVSFLKDGGQVRDIDVTSSTSIIREIYGDGTYLFRAFDGCYDGDFLNTDTVYRGYIRAIEVGGSKYDNPLRSINIGRIVAVEYDVEPDLTFVEIDLDTVVEGFKESINSGMCNVSRVVRGLKEVDLISEDEALKMKSFIELESWVESKSVVLGTVFLRALALYMLANPQDFPDYTGVPLESSETSFDLGAGVGLDDDGIGFDDGLTAEFES